MVCLLFRRLLDILFLCRGPETRAVESRHQQPGNAPLGGWQILIRSRGGTHDATDISIPHGELTRYMARVEASAHPAFSELTLKGGFHTRRRKAQHGRFRRRGRGGNGSAHPAATSQ